MALPPPPTHRFVGVDDEPIEGAVGPIMVMVTVRMYRPDEMAQRRAAMRRLIDMAMRG
jgi:hypothetical protein